MPSLQDCRADGGESSWAGSGVMRYCRAKAAREAGRRSLILAGLQEFLGGCVAFLGSTTAVAPTQHSSASARERPPLSHNLALPLRLMRGSQEGELEHLLQGLVLQYGYLAIFIIIGLESAGLPLPGEAALIAASLYAGATGHLHIALVIACAALGAVIGDNIGF